MHLEFGEVCWHYSTYNPSGINVPVHFTEELPDFEERIEGWPNVLPYVLFVHRAAPHSPTKFSPFFMVYQRQPVLPYELDDAELNKSEFEVEDIKEENIKDSDEEEPPFDMVPF